MTESEGAAGGTGANAAHTAPATAGAHTATKLAAEAGGGRAQDNGGQEPGEEEEEDEADESESLLDVIKYLELTASAKAKKGAKRSMAVRSCMHTRGVAVGAW